MGKRITIIDGHPDADRGRFCHALADAYAAAATAAGHDVRRLNLGEMDIPFLRKRSDWEAGEASAEIQRCQEAITFAEHLVIIFPLWLGSMPALLKAFFEQVFRPGFAIAPGPLKSPWPGLLKGKSARVVVTMGMPAFLYRWFYRAHSLKSLERNILSFVGLGPIRETLIGSIEGSAGKREQALAKIRALAAKGT